jgi:hypothetical protein
MRKFKVGDIVVGNREASKHYGITTEGWEGKVTEVMGGDQIRVEALSEDATCYTLNEIYFDLVTKEKQNKTEMKTVFQVGDIVIGKKPEEEPEYSITGEGWVGEVVSVGGDRITVRRVKDDGDSYQVESKHFSLLYKKEDYYITSKEFLIEAYRCNFSSYTPEIRKILAMDPLGEYFPVQKSIVEGALSDEGICDDWKNKIREAFGIVEDPFFNFGKNSSPEDTSYTIHTHCKGGPIMIGHGLVPDEEKDRCLLVSTEYELIVEDFKQYKKLKFKKK